MATHDEQETTHLLTTSQISTHSSSARLEKKTATANGTCETHPALQSPTSKSAPHVNLLPDFPKQVALDHGLSENFCEIEIGRSCQAVYLIAVQELFGHFGVDLNEPLGVHDVSAEIGRMRAMPVENLLDLENVPVSKRQGPGELRKTQIEGFDDDVETFDVNHIKSKRLSSLLEGDPQNSDDDSDDDMYLPSSLRTRERLFGLRRAPKKNAFVRVLMGSGYAKLAVRGQLVIAWCFRFGKHNSTFLKLAANTGQVLRELCSVAFLWKKSRDRKGVDDKADIGTFQLYRFTTNRFDPKWKKVDTRSSRAKESVILPGSMLEDIIEDVRSFLSAETQKWYKRHGIPQRRSFLFYGPPGCGKTSTINMLAGMFQLNACFLSMTSRDFCNEYMHDAITGLPSRPLLVLEDVDVLFNVDRENDTGNSLTFSGLLNALDGLISTNGVLSVFTTNHVEKLDAALIRAGRIDRRFEFRQPTDEHLAKVFKSFYPDCADGQAEQFSKEIMKRREPEARSIATLQQLFIYTRTSSAEECLGKVGEFFKKIYHDSNTDPYSIYS